MIKAVLFDIDNTLLDFDQCVKDAMREGFLKYELPPYREYMFDAFTLINNEIWKQFERGEIDFPGILRTRWQRVFDALNIAFDGYTFEKYFIEYIFHSHILVEGATEVLDYLSSKYIICAASNGPEKQQLNRLTEAGLLDYFQLLFISEAMGTVKPEKKFYLQVLDELNNYAEENILLENILVVGDSLSSDIAGGSKMGMKTCFFDFYGDAIIDKMVPDYVIKNLNDIKAII